MLKYSIIEITPVSHIDVVDGGDEIRDLRSCLVLFCDLSIELDKINGRYKFKLIYDYSHSAPCFFICG